MPAVDVLRILVIEDEFLIAAELEQAIAEFGCQCVGPFATVEQATQAIQSGHIDGAILNLVLQHERADDLAHLLEEKDIPFAFASAVDAADHDPRWHKKPKLTKPYRLEEVHAVLAELFPNEIGISYHSIVAETAPEEDLSSSQTSSAGTHD